jgi:hypothetical protein
MMLGGTPMEPMRLMQWTGIVVAAAGAMLMIYSGPLSHAWMGAHLPTGLPVHVDWFLPLGMVAMIGGGLLVQTTWKTGHG